MKGSEFRKTQTHPSQWSQISSAQPQPKPSQANIPSQGFKLRPTLSEA